MSRIDLLYLFYLYLYFSLVGGGGGKEGCPFTAKYKLKKKIQIKVVYDCAALEITKRSSNARLKKGEKTDDRLKGGGQTGQWRIQGKAPGPPLFLVQTEAPRA